MQLVENRKTNIVFGISTLELGTKDVPYKQGRGSHLTALTNVRAPGPQGGREGPEGAGLGILDYLKTTLFFRGRGSRGVLALSDSLILTYLKTYYQIILIPCESFIKIAQIVPELHQLKVMHL